MIKITDFSLAKIIPDDVFAVTACGTPGYVAPEILEGGGYGKEVDYWSIGVILYTLLCGLPPFNEEQNAELFDKIKTADYCFPSPEWDHVSDLAKDLISRLLVTDPDKRLTADEILEHPWMMESAIQEDSSDESD
jgi:calcium/calmodulin-dependent protein kinase I